MIAGHRFRGVLGVRNWVRSFKMVETGLVSGGKPGAEFEREVCVRKPWQALARRDAERQRRREIRRVGCGAGNGFVSCREGRDEFV